ncbi:universal stress protein [Brevibacterium salitolerans]|uniref:Universal stress protein n=1 Tax=Brevibacterium salitolerans TaxID=1403566 RepID=A0ABN2WLX2_9MICO
MNSGAHSDSHLIPFDPAARELGVIVGYDGSENATRALHYAARAAGRRGAVLNVITVYRVPTAIYTTYAALPQVPEDEAKKADAQTLLNAAAEFLKDYPGEVYYRAVEGDSVGALAELTSQAQLAVVGARGRGGFLGRILGSVASALPSHTQCPTVVVPHDYGKGESLESPDFTPVRSDAPVVVGVDQSNLSRVAALYAAAAAQERDTTLVMLMALPPLDTNMAWYPELASDVDRVTTQRTEELRAHLDEEVAWLKGHFPSVEIRGTVEVGEPSVLLKQMTSQAQLTVLGSRGRGAFVSALLGSTSRGVLYKAEGPVLVVPALDDPRLPEREAADAE